MFSVQHIHSYVIVDSLFFRSLDADQQALDMKRQLQVVEQEATVLRTRNQTLESDYEKMMAENKRLLLSQSKKDPTNKLSALDTKVRVIKLEKELDDAHKKVITSKRIFETFIP